MAKTSRRLFNALRLTLRAQPRSEEIETGLDQIFRLALTTSLPCDNLVAWQNLHWDAVWAH